MDRFHLIFLAAVLFLYVPCLAQPAAAPKEIFRDANGNLVSNNEFVDIRMANYNIADTTVVKTLADGTKEFQLQKIPQEGMRVPEFSVRTLDGNVISDTSLVGKVVVLSFWFIGCPACRNQEPKLNELRTKFAGRDDVVFLALTADPTADVKAYLAKNRIDYLHAAAADTAIKAFRVSYYPKNIVISKTGEIVYWRSTVHAWEKFGSVIEGELKR